jgi:hypothetical protein
MLYGTFTVSSAPGLGRHPPEKMPSSRQEPVKVASSSPYDTAMVTVSSWMFHVYGSGYGEKLEYTVDGNVLVLAS